MMLVSLVLQIAAIGLLHTYRFRRGEDHFAFGWEMGRVARSIALGQGFSNPYGDSTGPTAWEPPLYPYLIGGVFKIAGVYSDASAWVLLIINSSFTVLTCIPIFLIANKVFGARVAAWSAWIWALLPYTMYWSIHWVWDTTLTPLLLSLIVLVSLELEDWHGWKGWAIFGALWGVAALSNPSMLSFLPFSGLWVWYRRHKRGLPSTAGVVLASAIFFACLTPWLVRNYRTFGQFVFIRDDFGLQFRLGNGPYADGILMAYLQPNMNNLEFEKFRSMGERAYTEDCKRQAFAWIRNHPQRFVAISSKRFVYYWAGVPRATGSLRIFEFGPFDFRNSLFLASSVLAILGLVLAVRRKKPGAWLFLWLVLSYPTVYYLVFPHARYRHPIEPELLIVAVFLFSETGLNATSLEVRTPRVERFSRTRFSTIAATAFLANFCMAGAGRECCGHIPMFKKILVANRGEIAVRVIRACRELGIASVAVYSDVDRASLHVRKADEAYHLGAAPAAQSYLNIDKILEVAKRTGADAIHPGYGFLSENAEFAQACADVGVKFVGPTPTAMEMMGSKTRARQAMEKAGVPLVPGASRGLESFAEAERIAAKIGFPVMLKAAAGGGGKGMRLVHAPGELKLALEAAQSEAQRSFRDSEVYIEKAMVNPRHIEMQVLADQHGNTIYLGERECSIQRRHQKVLEESPSPIVDEEMRRHMGEVAVRVVKAAGYTNAGTVEFLVDQKNNFYFLEMNTRLQVEHPVTEVITGLDLVQSQIRIAAGEKLPLMQEDVSLRGHAIECRIYAEDPDNNYFPSPGKVTLLLEPSGPGIRCDSGIYEGWTVPIDYDPLLAKLIGYATDRQQAIARLMRGLDEYFIGGIKTNISLFRRILGDSDFQAGKLDTGYLERSLARPVEHPQAGGRAEVAAIAAGLFAVLDPSLSQNSSIADGGGRIAEIQSNWKRVGRAEGLS